MTSLKGIRRVVLLALTWAVLWAPVAVMVGITIDPDGSMDEMWAAIGAYPGFLCALAFCAVVAIAERDREFYELPLFRAMAWGAVAGLFVGALPFAIAESTPALARWQLGTVILGSMMLLSALSAVATVLVAGVAARRRAPAGVRATR